MRVTLQELTVKISQDTHEKKSSAIDPGTTLFGAANGSQKPKQVPDDFSKAQTRVCSIKECAKTFTNSFDQARDAIHQYMVSGHWTPTGSILMWSGDPVALDDAESAAVFTSLCNQSTSTGLCCDSIELCHGFVETIHLLSQDDAPVAAEPDAFRVHSSEIESAESTINSDSDDSTLTDLSTTHSVCTESQSDWFARVSLRHDGSPPEEHTPIANRPIRNCTRPVLYTPSPSGIARDVVSSGEFYARRRRITFI